VTEEIRFVDTTLRDGHASLWAEAMRTGMMLAVAEDIARSGVVASEIIATSHFKKCVRELREDPWVRVREVAARMSGIDVAAMSGRVSTFDIDPASVRRLWLHRLAANGITRVQLMHPSNNMTHLIPSEVQFAKEAGLKVVLAIVFSISPRHTDEHFAERTRDAAALQPDIIYLKDSGGLLTPDRVRTLVPVMLEATGGIPLEYHGHCTTGMAAACYMEAIQLGIRTLHTAIPPLAEGSSQPSIFNTARNVRHLGYRPVVDEQLLQGSAEKLHEMARRAGLPIGVPVEYDYAQYLHQIPGGVISNLRHQLRQMRMLDRLDEAFQEIIRVRQELGYPIMVTPFSQFVVSQAAINLFLGERYQQVTDELLKFALGHWGKDSADGIDPNVKDRLLDRPRARELAGWQLPEPTIEEVRQRIGGQDLSDDELLLRYIMRGREEIEIMRATKPADDYGAAQHPLVTLIEELTSRQGRGQVVIQKGELTLQLGRSGDGTGAAARPKEEAASP
jgi:oxaloacetate decarboxylase alpha subunit